MLYFDAFVDIDFFLVSYMNGGKSNETVNKLNIRDMCVYSFSGFCISYAGGNSRDSDIFYRKKAKIKNNFNKVG